MQEVQLPETWRTKAERLLPLFKQVTYQFFLAYDYVPSCTPKDTLNNPNMELWNEEHCRIPHLARALIRHSLVLDYPCLITLSAHRVPHSAFFPLTPSLLWEGVTWGGVPCFCGRKDLPYLALQDEASEREWPRRRRGEAGGLRRCNSPSGFFPLCLWSNHQLQTF